jgi:ribose transport system ATP-binding protein
VVSDPILSFRNCVKVFGGNRAVDDVSFDVEAGTICALLGENGAGKSTLIKMLAGVYKRDSGQILCNGVDVDTPGGRDGIAFIHQDLGLLEWMTVAENMAMGFGFATSRGFISWNRVQRRAAEALELIGGGIDPRARVFDLTRAEKSLLAIARALAVDCRVLVLDEPTASLPEADVIRLFDVLHRLRAEGVAMIFVSHRLDEVFRIADRTAIMRDGVLVHEGPVAELDQDELVRHVVGRRPVEVRAGSAEATGAEVLAVDGVELAGVGPIDLEVAEGEIVALVGLRGAGHARIGRMLCGLEAHRAGQVRLDGQPVAFASPREAIDNGVAFVTSNREAESMAVSLSVRENLFINPQIRGRGTFSPVRRATERARALPIVRRFNVRPGNPEQEIGTLSGGNQQKVILARWLDIGARLLVLEEPTMGVDIGAKAEIYNHLGDALAEGTAIVVVSTDFEEVANVAHRALVFNRGRVAAELAGPDLNLANLLRHAAGTAVPDEPRERAAL